MFVVITALCVAFAVIVPAERRRRAVVELEAVGYVRYASEDSEAQFDRVLRHEGVVRDWWRECENEVVFASLGGPYVDPMHGYTFTGAKTTDDELRNLAPLTGLRRLSLQEAPITDAGLGSRPV
jgi:hypothetical protein